LGILHRTIFWELAKVFVLSLLGITGIIVLAAIVVEASQRGLGPTQILAAIPLLVPSMMPFIVPPTTLFASCVVYGRLSHDNEIIAIKAAGINVLHLIWPGVFLGVAMSAATMGLYYDLIPFTHRVLRERVTSDIEEFLYAILKRDHEITRRPELKLDYEIFVEQVQGRKLKNAIFMRRDSKGDYDLVAKAREAELRVNRNAGEHGEIIVHMRHGNVVDHAGKTRGTFEDEFYSVPLPKIEPKAPSPRDLTWQELLEARRAVEEECEKRAAELALTVAQENLVVPPTTLTATRKGLEYNLQHTLYPRRNSLNTELQMRPALSCGCLFFVLVGCPVGIWFSRSDYLSAFISCFLPIVFIYYPLQLCSTNLSKDGKIHPAIALWAANTVVGIIALGLFRKLLKN
jgi:lipopolysaccharide export system permease protein